LARAIRKLQPALSIVLVTGYSDVALEAAQEFTVLRKPYGVEDLTRAFGPSIPSGSLPSGRAHIVDFRGAELPKGRRNT
jgi:ActR/RegA family two-component response regulator